MVYLKETKSLDKMAFGMRLSAIRRVKNLTSEQLSELCGVDNTHIRHIESGSRSPSIRLLVRLCNVLQVSPYYFLQDCIELEKDETDKVKGLVELFPELSTQKANAVKDIIEILNNRFPEN